MKANKLPVEPAESHVSLELLRQYQADALAPAEQHQVEKHLLDCDLCADILAGMEASKAPQTQSAVQEINQRVAASLQKERKVISFYTEWKNYGVAAALVLFILSGALVFYANFRSVKQEQKTVAIQKQKANQENAIIVQPAAPAIAENLKNVPVTGEKVDDRQTLAINTPENSNQIRFKSGSGNAPRIANENLNEVTIPGEIDEKKLIVTAPRIQTTIDAETDRDLAKGKVVGATAPVSGQEVATVPDPQIEHLLQGRAAGVAASKPAQIATKIQIRGNASSSLENKSSISGRLVNGKITDDNGQPLAGVTVLVKGTSIGAATNHNGEYTLLLHPGFEKATIIASFIGYTTAEIPIVTKDQPVIAQNISMKADAKSLSEVVVVGYGTQAKKDVTGAISYAKPASGFRAFKKYVQANLKYPEEAKAKKIKGRVVVGFTVNAQGELSDFKIIKSLSPACDAEALRLVQQGPRWEPTKKDEVAVTEQVRMAIRFKPTK